MIDRALFPLTLLAALGSGLVGGVFFAFSAFVMAALARLPPAQGIAAMKAINVTVLNRWFMAPFFGTAAVCAALVLAALPRWREPDALVRLLGGGLYLVGGIGVTVAANVPRNDALAAVAPDGEEAATLWARYVSDWTTWNTVRAAASLAAAAALTIALTGTAGRVVEALRGR